MNYQYRYGNTTTAAIKTLWWDGGFGRYYQGLTPALIQGKPALDNPAPCNDSHSPNVQVPSPGSETQQQTPGS